MDCDERRRALLERIKRTDRYSARRLPDQLRRQTLEFAKICEPYMAVFLRILADNEVGTVPYEATCNRLRRLASSARSSEETKCHAYSHLAKLQYQRDQSSDTYPLRAEALRCARAAGLNLRELVVVANWAIVALELHDDDTAQSMLTLADKKLRSTAWPESAAQTLEEVRGRLRAVRDGKLTLRGLDSLENEGRVPELLQYAVDAYTEAMELDPTNAHRQVHSRVEFVDELMSVRAVPASVKLMLARPLLDGAHAALLAHSCRPCEAFYYHARGKYLECEANELRDRDVGAALTTFERAIASVDLALTIQEHQLQHPTAAKTRKHMEILIRAREIIARPRKVFLSHSSKDKLLVREYSMTLELLKYEPWLDEEAMAAGALLERSLLAGMKDSCAAVFFVTENFEDHRFLATEVDYAVEQKRERGSQFSIITLVLGKPTGATVVPDLLRRFVWKEPRTELEGLRELVRALPLKPSCPRWFDETTPNPPAGADG